MSRMWVEQAGGGTIVKTSPNDVPDYLRIVTRSLHRDSSKGNYM
jgi:hypothetical protein